MASNFNVIHKDPTSNARVGRLVTSHGIVNTPAFMPVGTQGTVKAMLPRDLKEIGCRIVLGNTYHLYLRPGAELIASLGGLHRFMGWDGPTLTDSGGFQVFSLAAMRKVAENGVQFQSHLDGSYHWITPEKAVEIQELLGSDIAMVLDECVPHNAPWDYVHAATERTIRWAERGLNVHKRRDQLLFAIVQGGTDEALRARCVEALLSMPFDGLAVGGLGIGEGKQLLYSVGAFTASMLPKTRPRYLMGVGRPQDILYAVRAGFDLFDCVIPTRNARNGTLFTSEGKLSIKRAEYARDPRPLDAACGCYTCCNFSRAYLRHLFTAGEILAAQLNSWHNIYFYERLMEKCRQFVARGEWESWNEETGFSLAQGH